MQQLPGKPSLLPILFKLKRPVPLEVFIFVVVHEARFDSVVAPGEHTGWHLLDWGGV